MHCSSWYIDFAFQPYISFLSPSIFQVSYKKERTLPIVFGIPTGNHPWKATAWGLSSSLSRFEWWFSVQNHLIDNLNPRPNPLYHRKTQHRSILRSFNWHFKSISNNTLNIYYEIVIYYEILSRSILRYRSLIRYLGIVCRATHVIPVHVQYVKTCCTAD